MVDVEITAKHLLPAQLHRLFQCHYIKRQGWREACITLGVKVVEDGKWIVKPMERGTFFRQVYMTEQALGRIWLTLKPYALWPLDEYFLPMISGKSR